MRISFVNQAGAILLAGFPRDSISICIEEVTRRLSSRAEVTIYSRHARGLPHEEERGGVRYVRVDASLDRWLRSLRALDRLRLVPARRPIFASRLHHLAYARSVARDLRERGCDIVHLFNYTQYAPAIRGSNPLARLVLHMQCQWLTQLDPERIRGRLGEVARILACSRFVEARIQERFPEFADRVLCLPNGVDVARFRPPPASVPPSPPELLYVGRISPEKGVHVLLEAFRSILRSHPEARLTIVGPHGAAPREVVMPGREDPTARILAPLWRGSYRARLESLRKGLPPGRVSFVGDVPHSLVEAHYARAHLLVLPSVWDEPFGIPAVEGMAAGLPVVATRGGAFPEIVEDGRTGILVGRGDAEELAGAIRRLLDDPPLREAMGREGRRRALAHYGWETVVERLWSEYQAIASSCAFAPRPGEPRSRFGEATAAANAPLTPAESGLG